MGDRPDPIVFPNECPGSIWAGGMAPPFIKVFFSGILKGSSWHYSYGDPPSGFFYPEFITCGLWYAPFGIKDIWVLLVDGNLTVVVNDDPRPQNFASKVPIEDPATGDSLLTDPSGAFYGGQSITTLYSSGHMLPRSWDGGLLMGAPAVNPYKAEELTTTLAARKTRIACHRDGTNIKIYGDY